MLSRKQTKSIPCRNVRRQQPDTMRTYQMQGQFRLATQRNKVMCIFQGPGKAIQQYSFPGMIPHTSFHEGDHNGRRYQFSPCHDIADLPA
eukprot:scaffold3341_cov171-Amphora_coffeaeformis.AAC.9